MNNWRWASAWLAVILALLWTSSAEAQRKMKRKSATEAEVRKAVQKYLSDAPPKALLELLPLVEVRVSDITYQVSGDRDLLGWRVESKRQLTPAEQAKVEKTLRAILEAALVGRRQRLFSERYYRAYVVTTFVIVLPKLPPPVLEKKKDTPVPVPASAIPAFPPVVFVPAAAQPGWAPCSWWQPPASGTWWEPPPSGTWWQPCP